MRRIAVLIALAALLTNGGAVHGTGQSVATSLIRYDADSTTLTFCAMIGANGSPFGGPVSGAGRILTSGSSTTVVSETASSGALAPVDARDAIFVRRTPTATDISILTAKASNDSVTVDAAVNWTGWSYTYLKTTCGTTSADGWFDTANSTRTMMTIQYLQGDLDALAWQFQCIQAAPGSQPEVVYPSEGDGCGNSGTQSGGFCEFATAAATTSFTWEEFGSWSRCRIAFKVKTTDTSDAGANLEQVSGAVIVSAGQF